MLFIIDIQYYLNKFLKEACVLSLSPNAVAQHFTFKADPPLHTLSAKDRKTVDYVHHHLGVIHWNEGQCNLKDFIHVFPGGAIVLCIGLEKSLFLTSLLPLCIIVNVNVSFSKLNHIHSTCPLGKQHSHCAWTRAHQLNAYLTTSTL